MPAEAVFCFCTPPINSLEVEKISDRPAPWKTVNDAHQWVLSEADPELVESLRRGLHVPRPVAMVLANRGIEDVRAAERFLNPTLRDLYPPEMLQDMARAAERIEKALVLQEPVVVYGDYDADGITSMALLLCFFRGLGIRTIPVIPDRERDGYGVSLSLLRDARREGGRLVITVDCGSSDMDAILAANEMGMEIIVTDHHEMPQGLPPAHAVINPKRSDNAYPYRDLAGVGVAFMLIWAVARRVKERGFWRPGAEPSLKKYLDLVALGTVADQAPLLGENRALVIHGLRQIVEQPRPGVSALLEICGFRHRIPSVGTLVFQVAPRLNAPGRLQTAHSALELLLTENLQEAQELAHVVNGMNCKRQEVEEGIYREVCVLAERQIEKGHRAIILSSEAWHLGVVGIVASRLVDRYGLPTVLLAVQDGTAKGSARSPDGFHLVENLKACDSFLQRYGGHAVAAGLKADCREIPAFRKAFCRLAAIQLGDRIRIPSLRIDGYLTPDQITPEFVRQLSRLEPHGIGNPEPIFRVDRLQVAQCRLVGQDHLKLMVHRDGYGFDVIGFGLGMAYGRDLEGYVHLACLPQLNEWQGRRTIQLKLRDLKFLSKD